MCFQDLRPAKMLIIMLIVRTACVVSLWWVAFAHAQLGPWSGRCPPPRFNQLSELLRKDTGEEKAPASPSKSGSLTGAAGTPAAADAAAVAAFTADDPSSEQLHADSLWREMAFQPKTRAGFGS